MRCWPWADRSYAAGNRAKIVRLENGKRRDSLKVSALINNGDMRHNLALQPGDVLVIPNRGSEPAGNTRPISSMSRCVALTRTAVTAWIIARVGGVFVFALPDVYEANSRVFVDTKTALSPVLEDLVLDQDVNAQLNLVRQSLLAGPQLEPVAIEVGLLDNTANSPQERVRILGDLRSRIDLWVARAATEGSNGDAGSIYSLRYTDPSRDRAVRVVEILQNNLIENTLGGKRTGSESAQKFLETPDSGLRAAPACR